MTLNRVEKFFITFRFGALFGYLAVGVILIKLNRDSQLVKVR